MNWSIIADAIIKTHMGDCLEGYCLTIQVVKIKVARYVRIAMTLCVMWPIYGG